MNWVDAAMLAVVLLSALAGFLRGFARELLGLAAWVGAIVGGRRGAPPRGGGGGGGGGPRGGGRGGGRALTPPHCCRRRAAGSTMRWSPR